MVLLSETLLKKKKGVNIEIFLSDSNSEVLKKYAEIWSGIKDQIKKRND